MDKLDKMYEAIEMLEALGMPVSGEQLRAVADLEKEYLSNEILPLIKQELDPLVSKMRKKFCVEMKYDKDTGLNIRIVEEKPQESLFEQNTRKTGSRQKKYILRVIFPDGHSVCHRIVGETLCDVVKYAGPRRVQELGMYIMGLNLVSETLHENERYSVGQKEVAPGLYCCTYSSTDVKLEQIKQMNRELNLGLKIEKVMI